MAVVLNAVMRTSPNLRYHWMQSNLKEMLPGNFVLFATPVQGELALKRGLFVSNFLFAN